MSFAQKIISITVQLAQNTQTNQPSTFQGTGVSGADGTDTVNLTGHRVQVRVENSGSPVSGRAQVKVWGMTPSLMNQLSTLGLVFNLVPKNTLTIQAGELVNGAPNLSNVFTGTIWAAYGDYAAQPDVPFIFECLSGAADATINVPPSSFPGSTDVGNMMAGFARQLNLGFENNGVSMTMTNSYFSGSALRQAEKCAREAGIGWGIISSVLAIWPRGSNRNTPNAPEISPQTGMIGYPAFTQQGIVTKTLFNPQIAFGGLVSVKSSLLSGIAAAQPTQPNALGNSPSTFPSQWAVNKLDLALDSLLPNGDWMSIVYGYNPNYSRSIIAPGS